MNWKRDIEIAAIALLLIGAVWYLRNWHDDIVAKAIADAEHKNDLAVQSKIDAALAARQSQYDKDRASDVQKYAQATTPAQMAQIFAQFAGGKPPVIVLPGQPAPAQTPQGGAVASQGTGAQTSNGTATLTLDQFTATTRGLEQGDLCKKDLAKCQADGIDWKSKWDKSQEDLKTSREALAGGTRKSRLWKGAKCLMFGAGGAGVGALVDKKRPAFGATIGSAVGTGSCELFF